MQSQNSQNGPVAGMGGPGGPNGSGRSIGSTNSGRPHQGDMGVPGLDGGLRPMTIEEQKEQRKKKGLCVTCGDVQTHKRGIWKSMMPQVSRFDDAEGGGEASGRGSLSCVRHV